jgi:hypothetical protein
LRRSVYLGGIAVVALLLIALWGWWLRPETPPPATTAAVSASPPASAAATSPVASAPHYPVDTDASAASGASPALEALLGDLLGAGTVRSLFRLDDFPRRLAATVDNLGRSHAPPVLWPVHPVGGRFTVEARSGETFIGADNALRYTPYVLLLERVDLRRAMEIYRLLYPTLQRAYEDLGYPRGYLNDRLVEVLDLLLATPELDAPVQVRLPPIDGPVQPKRPWVLYEFVDPHLQALTSGQKLLIRMGPVNERRVKARLAEIRRLARGVGAGGPSR